jgi:hypothetical protein
MTVLKVTRGCPEFNTLNFSYNDIDGFSISGTPADIEEFADLLKNFVDSEDDSLTLENLPHSPNDVTVRKNHD